MPFFKKNIPTLIFLVLVYSWFLISNVVSRPVTLEVLGANSNITLSVQPDAGRQLILDAIDNARQEVLVEVYLLSDKQIIEALGNAEGRGVAVNVMLEQHPFGGSNLNNKSEKTLRENGVAVKWTNPSFSLTHEKAIVIDGIKAFILNQNLTASAFTKNREYNIIDTNPKDVSEIRNIFMADWERREFNPTSTYLIISPKNSRAALTTLIKSAIKTIDIEMEYIEDEKIVSLLSDKVRNTEIRLLIPTFTQFAVNKDAARRLVQAGVSVKTLSSPYIHAKMILIDDVKAYVGSINLSTQSMDENRELGIMLSENESIKTLVETFSIDWNLGTQVN